MSISALTGGDLQRQGIRDMDGISRQVPSLNFRPTGSIRESISIRGIQSDIGAATTGVYMDDVSVTRNIVPGGNVNVAPIPALFDLDRVEVLRGPQGTLYGGSSQGGAVRFITTAPSLDGFSANMRSEVGFKAGGDPSGEFGVAVGGPIVPGKLAIRLAGWASEKGGWIDRIEPRTGRPGAENVNGGNRSAFRGSILWKVNERLSLTGMAYTAGNKKQSLDTYWLNVPAYTVPGNTYDVAGNPTSVASRINYTRAPVSYPALDYFDAFKTGDVHSTPIRDRLEVFSITLDHQNDWFDTRIIVADVTDTGRATVYDPTNVFGHVGVITGYFAPIPGAVYNTNLPYSNAQIEEAGPWATYGRRSSQQYELRLSSKRNRRLEWVGGLYYSRSINNAYGSRRDNLDDVVQYARGVSANTFYRFNISTLSVDHLINGRAQKLSEDALAAYGEATLSLTERLKVTGGLRVTKSVQEYNSAQTGYIFRVTEATLANGNLVQGRTEETPITPKVLASYQLTSNDMIYATAAKGFRIGGVNGAIPQTKECTDAFTAAGLLKPEVFGSDSVWSYEAGAKLRVLGGRAQINASIYQIDWSDIQAVVRVPGCNFNYVDNAASARSRGFELQADARIWGGLRANASVAHTDAAYTMTVLGPPSPTGTRALFVEKGQNLPVNPWTVVLGLEYRSEVLGNEAFVRGDYTYSEGYFRGFPLGTTSYTPDFVRPLSTSLINMRAGVVVKDVDVSIFVRNVLNSRDLITEGDAYPWSQRGGRRGCTDAACANPTVNNIVTQVSTFEPRTVGLTVAYRY